MFEIPPSSIWGIDYRKAFEALTISVDMQEHLVDWMEWGKHTSPFLDAIINNDLARVFTDPDRTQQAAVRGVVRFFTEYGPENCASFRRDGNAYFNWPRRVEVQRKKWLEDGE